MDNTVSLPPPSQLLLIFTVSNRKLCAGQGARLPTQPLRVATPNKKAKFSVLDFNNKQVLTPTLFGTHWFEKPYLCFVFT